MELTLLYRTPTYAVIILLFLLSLLFHWIGYKIKQKRIKEKHQTKNENLGPVEGSLLGLLALLLAFTFNMASTRFDQRRQIIVEEANHIGTAILRADLYPDSIRIPIRSDFKKYVEARIVYYNAGIDDEKLNTALQQSDRISSRIWKRIAEAAHDPKNLVRSAQMIPAMNNMIDVVTTRDTTKNASVPESILWLLLVLVLSSSFIIGYDNEKKINKVLIVGFATMISLTVFVILDLDRPRRGLIKNDRAEQKIEALRNMFEENKPNTP